MNEPPRENQAITGRGRMLVAIPVLVVIALAAAELGVRTEDWARWRTPFWSPATGFGDLAVRDAAGMHPRPGARFNKWRINEVGTRGDSPDPAHADRRVLILGASESFGQYESPDREYPRQLQDSLRATGCAADVLNAGFPGMSLPTVEQDLRLRLAALRPRVVVYYPTPPQYLDEVLPQAAIPDSSGDTAAPAWRPRSRLLPRMRNQLKGMLPDYVQDVLRQRDIERQRAGTADDWLFRDVPADRLDAFEVDLRHLVGTIRGAGAIPVLLTHANAFTAATPMPAASLTAWERFYPRATGEVLVRFDSLAALRIERVAADSGLVLGDPWRHFHEGSAPENFADFSHFNDRGAGRMATLLRPIVSPLLGCPAGADSATASRPPS